MTTGAPWCSNRIPRRGLGRNSGHDQVRRFTEGDLWIDYVLPVQASGFTYKHQRLWNFSAHYGPARDFFVPGRGYRVSAFERDRRHAISRDADAHDGHVQCKRRNDQWLGFLSRRGLTDREKFALKMREKIPNWCWPTEAEIRNLSHYAELVEAGRDWVACADRLPYEDETGQFHYLVLFDGCDGWLQCCRYVGGQRRWLDGECRYVTGRWQIGDDGFIGGVTHWRLAAEGECRSRAATRAEARVLRRLPGHIHHW